MLTIKRTELRTYQITHLGCLVTHRVTPRPGRAPAVEIILEGAGRKAEELPRRVRRALK